ncbi:Pleckstrin y domain-containing protein 1 [Tetrabaena socialis]|uniref:Pleckstrin y domain-containing protein 1 n=1 Tax=Tetrabaena socialis TaxID=47790 RepID=A0A2J7ZWV1_9CHLO|nr:Pleckstrin y domain-containing protein 1 [Tetrabaena socialis]|eukprot:PNH04753.1 Pleckstrin y domain-containing protein 1 [Tetrabaena socialis]
MQALWGGRGAKDTYGGVEYWHSPERCGWLQKQGEYIKTWRRRWFVMKQGKIFWFKGDVVTPDSVPRGVVDVNKCLSIKGAEDTINKANAFEISTQTASMFFIADTDKEKEDWINAIGRAIVKHSRSLLDHDRPDYTNQ